MDSRIIETLIVDDERIARHYILAIDNLTGKAAWYNVLSRFSGTHFLQPRPLIAQVAGLLENCQLFAE